MKVFKDMNGREWAVKINVAQAKRVRDLLNVNLYGIVQDGMAGLGKLLGDPITLVDLLYVLCREEADKAGISDERFGEALGGDALKAAAEAFVAELIDFFPDPAARAALTAVVEKSKAMRALVTEEATRDLEALDPKALAAEVRRQILEEAARKAATDPNSPEIRLNGSPGGSRASSASTRRRSRSAS